MEWRPTTAEEIKRIVRDDLAKCDSQQVATFERYSVEPCLAPIWRCGSLENVFVVARKGDEVIYREETEEGFNVSPVAPECRILEHWCNQDELSVALNNWIDGRLRPDRFGPAARRD